MRLGLPHMKYQRGRWLCEDIILGVSLNILHRRRQIVMINRISIVLGFINRGRDDGENQSFYSITWDAFLNLN